MKEAAALGQTPPLPVQTSERKLQLQRWTQEKLFRSQSHRNNLQSDNETVGEPVWRVDVLPEEEDEEGTVNRSAACDSIFPSSSFTSDFSSSSSLSSSDEEDFSSEELANIALNKSMGGLLSSSSSSSRSVFLSELCRLADSSCVKIH